MYLIRSLLIVLMYEKVVLIDGIEPKSWTDQVTNSCLVFQFKLI